MSTSTVRELRAEIARPESSDPPRRERTAESAGGARDVLDAATRHEPRP